MFQIPGSSHSPSKASIEEEKKAAKKAVWTTVEVFVAYVAILRIGKVPSTELEIKFSSRKESPYTFQSLFKA